MLARGHPRLWWDSHECRHAFDVRIDGHFPIFNRSSGVMLHDGSRNDVAPATHTRHATWEDTWTTVRLRAEDERLLNTPFDRCARRFCQHVGVPVAVRTRVRPVRGFVHAGNRSRFAIPIEKVASSSLKKVYGYRHLSRCVHKTASALFASMPNSTACGYSGSFGWRSGLESVIVVRNPFARFMSSLNDHGPLVCSNADCRLLRKARQLVSAWSRRSIVMKLFPPEASIHMYTQSYFVSATDAGGRPVEWTQIRRLEEGNVSSVVKNVKRQDYSHIVRLLMADRALRCGLCAIYAQDFVCFGYTGCEDCDAGHARRATI